MDNRRNPLSWNFNLGPLRFNTPASPLLILLLVVAFLCCCCCGPMVEELLS